VSERTRGGRGWYDFAGSLLGLAGLFNGIEGLGVIFRKEHFAESALLYQNLAFWGWVWLVLGVLQIGTAIALFDGRGRVIGMVLAGLSAVVAFISLDAAPIWSVVVIAVDVLVIHGLARNPEPPVDLTTASVRMDPGRDVPLPPR
jgi:hypothetical protein